MLLELLQQLYGNDFINIVLKIVFEFMMYFMFGLFGSGVKEYFIEKDKCLTRVSRMVGIAFITAVIMFIFGNFLKEKITDARLLFGFGVGLSLYLPNLKKTIKNGTVLKHIVGLFSDKLRKMLDDIDKEK